MAQEKKIILVVEDDIDIGEILVDLLTDDTDCQVVLAEDGFEALEIVEANMPCLFILDYYLPLMNGIELYDRICLLKEQERLPAVMLSANLPLRAVESRQIVGMHKPFGILQLLDAVQRLLTS
jgi:CheY-like chemotaxis protein